MRVKAGDDDRLDTQFLEEDVQVRLEEAAVAALRDHIVAGLRGQFGNHLGAGRALDGVVAPDLQFAVDAGKVAVVAINHGNTLFAGRLQQAGGGGKDFHGAGAADGTGHEVVEHVDDQDGGMVEFFHF